MKTLIIAEAGVNHNGSIEVAKNLIDVAVEAGADLVKFQLFKAERLATPLANLAEYQKHSESDLASQLQLLLDSLQRQFVEIIYLNALKL